MEKSTDIIMSHWQMFESTFYFDGGGGGGGYIYSIWSKSLHLILKIDQIEGADWVLNS